MRPTTDLRRLVTLGEAIAFLRISRSKLYALMTSGEVPYVKLGKSRRIQLSALVDLIDARTHRGRIGNIDH